MAGNSLSLPTSNVGIVSCMARGGTAVRASCTRLTQFVAVFENYGPENVLLLSEVLGDFVITIRGRTAYSGRAVVRNIVNSGLVEVCEVELAGGWVLLDGLSGLSHTERLASEYAEFIQGFQLRSSIEPEFKVHVADMQDFFQELRAWLSQLEIGTKALPIGEQLAAETEVASLVAKQVIPYIDGLFEKLEAIAPRIDDRLQPLHRAYLKRQLHPLVLCSPFAHRTFSKPLGYPGDFEMVNMIWRNGIEGVSLFAKVLNCWFLHQPPAVAHRNRILYLTEKLKEEALRVRALCRPLRVFNLACGPAAEVQEFVKNSNLYDGAEISLADFNGETLDYLSGALTAITRTRARTASFSFIKRSVHQYLKDGARGERASPQPAYDFVYCAGLFDYLPDTICRRLMSILYDWLAPGGLLLATNVDSSNPLQHGMDYLLDWNLVYRDALRSAGLIPESASAGANTVRSDVTGVNLMIEVRKPEHV